MSALRRTSVFLVQGNKLRVSSVESVIRDFYEDKKEDGRQFSFGELRDLVKVIRSPDSFCESSMFEQFGHYALPFLEKKSLKSKRASGLYGKKENYF